MKNIYLITRKEVPGYDEFSGCVVIASTEEEARNMCPFADEGKYPWLDPDSSDCETVGTTEIKESQVLLSSFHAG